MVVRWGMPSRSFVLKDRNSDPGIANIRNTTSPYWRRFVPFCGDGGVLQKMDGD
jgi:putative SOS response-associated peptidase YedK